MKTELRTNKNYAIYYIFWSKFLLVEIVPYTTIVILNSRIIKEVFKGGQFRRQFSVSNKYVTKYL